MRYPRGSKVVKLTQGYEAIVSAEDYELLSQVSWHVHKSRGNVYARATVGGRKIFMHRLLCGIWRAKSKGHALQVDHRNHRTLDNRRENLYVVSHTENLSRRRKKGTATPPTPRQPTVQGGILASGQ